MFNKNSGLVKVWVSLIMVGTYELEDTPKIANLKEVVSDVVKEMTGDIAPIEPKPAAEPTAEEQPADEPVDLMAAAQ